MPDPETNNLKRCSLICLVLVLIIALLQMAGYYQTQYQLVSPLIPKAITDKISKPYLLLAGISFALFLVALPFHYYSKYIVSIVVCVIGIVFPYLYMQM